MYNLSPEGAFFKMAAQIVLVQYQISFSKQFCLKSDQLLVWSLLKD